MPLKRARQNHSPELLIKNFSAAGEREELVDYPAALAAMQAFTRERSAETVDQLWVLEHAPVFTLGQAASEQHLRDTGDIPVIKTDRGGQVTYHGPGQLMFYLMANLDRLGIGVRDLVIALEKTTVCLLQSYGITSSGDRDAPGVYVGDKKIAALGLRVSRRCCYHGLCLNYNFNAAPFSGINPCGYQGLKNTQLSEYVLPVPEKGEVIKRFVEQLTSQLGYVETRYEQRSWVRDASLLND